MTTGHETLARGPGAAVSPGAGDRDGDAGALTIGRATLDRLRWFNAVMGALHLVSAVVMLALANGFELSVGAIQLQGPPGTPLADSTLGKVGDVRLAWATAAFLLLSAVFHAIIAGPGYGTYRRELRHGRNRFRWVEYSLSATLMIVLIALVTGVVDLAALIAIAFANTAMILFGWIMEVVNTPGARTWWTPFWFGCIAGAGPWLAIAAYLAYNVGSTDVGPPGFVYGILISIFVLFNSFALNQWLQYRQVGPWRRYEFGEAVYIVLSLTAKSALAWQIFANTLI
ncbi:MAG: heliorhodopsin HeR [Acidimicrobiia bacterium]